MLLLAPTAVTAVRGQMPLLLLPMLRLPLARRATGAAVALGTLKQESAAGAAMAPPLRPLLAMAAITAD
eukprot:8945417-Alexandrium_andersonii.AAC.1